MKTKIIFEEETCYCCKKRSNENFVVDFEKVFFKKVMLCKKCAGELYSKVGKILVPKSPENIYKKLKIKE